MSLRCLVLVGTSYSHIVLQVLYHVLGVVPAYQSSVGPALNELCLGLQSDELGPVRVYVSHDAKSVPCL